MRSTKIVEAYGKLLLATAKAKKEAPNFNSSLVRLESMLRLIWPLIDEKQELKKLTDVFRDGKILVDKCITIRSWHIINCYTHSKKLKKLHDSLSYIFGINPDPISPEAIRAMDRIIAMFAKKKEDGRSDAISVEEIAHTPPTIFMETLVVVDKQEDGLSDAISAPLQQCRHFTFAEIQSATQNFDNALVIGKGGFGKVYRGFIDSGATIVAIKRLDPMSNQGDNEFRTEVEMLSKFRHCNLVSLIGYCYDGREMILVYEYMVNGSMADVLHPKDGRRNGISSHLSWVQRLKICIGAARGIEYLHTGTGVLQRVIHRDVKSSNILLDENWAAKVSDFGLCKLGPANQSCTHVSTCVKGTPGYCDPDYFLTHRVTRKSDVFSFGVVLFEVLSGKPALDLRLPKEQRSLMAWAQHCIQQNTPHKLIDPNLKWEIRSNSLEAFVGIAAQSLQNESKKRPTMAKVVLSLESALAIQTSKDSSLLNEDIYDFGETYDIDDCSLQSQGGSADNNYNESSKLDENERGIKTETEMNNDDGTSTSTKDINGDRWCINCGKVEACMLLFLCRHLCICSACNSLLHACPICNSTKTSSVHINMSS